MNENQPPPEDLSVNREFEVQNQLPANLPQEKPSIWRQEIFSYFAVFGGFCLFFALLRIYFPNHEGRLETQIEELSRMAM